MCMRMYSYVADPSSEIDGGTVAQGNHKYFWRPMIETRQPHSVLD